MKQSKPATPDEPVSGTVVPSTQEVDDCLRQGLAWHDELIEARRALALAKPALINTADVLAVVAQHAAYLGVDRREIVKWEEQCREAHAAIMRCETEMIPMTRIFRLEVDGATYWVSAATSEDAVIALRNDDAVEDKDMTPESVVPVSRADAGVATIDNGNGETVSLWRAFCEDVSPRVIACSEWA